MNNPKTCNAKDFNPIFRGNQPPTPAIPSSNTTNQVGADNLRMPSTFLRNLYSFLNTNALPDAIAWDADGKSFSILNPDKMEDSLPMPRLYRGRYKTFKMQLEKHGFAKERGSEVERYWRPDFVKGRPQHIGELSTEQANAAMINTMSPIKQEQRSSSIESVPASNSERKLECRVQVPKDEKSHCKITIPLGRKRKVNELSAAFQRQSINSSPRTSNITANSSTNIKQEAIIGKGVNISSNGCFLSAAASQYKTSLLCSISKSKLFSMRSRPNPNCFSRPKSAVEAPFEASSVSQRNSLLIPPFGSSNGPQGLNACQRLPSITSAFPSFGNFRNDKK